MAPSYFGKLFPSPRQASRTTNDRAWLLVGTGERQG
jgi:hypothetical protein